MPKYYEFEVAIRDIEPRIWRRFLLSSTVSFKALHEAIQDASGWWLNYHLFEFQSTSSRSKWPEVIAGCPDEFEPNNPLASRVRLSQFFTGLAPQACLYLYDFGDGWEADIVLRNVVELPDKFKRKLLDGARAFPHEDCGGVSGYERMVEFVRTGKDPYNEEPDELREWLDGWDPEKFDLEEMKAGFNK